MADRDEMIARARVVADELLGTCNDEAQHATAEELNDTDFLLELDNIVFCCVSCGWWCDIGEAIDNGQGEDECQDCHGEDDDE